MQDLVLTIKLTPRPQPTGFPVAINSDLDKPWATTGLEETSQEIGKDWKNWKTNAKHIVCDIEPFVT